MWHHESPDLESRATSGASLIPGISISTVERFGDALQFAVHGVTSRIRCELAGAGGPN